MSPNIIRKDYLLDRWVYYATGRKKRPHEFKKNIVKKSAVKICFFCPSNENLTPPEIGRVEYEGKWKMRWFLNKFSAIDKKGNPKVKSIKSNTELDKLFLQSDAYGFHEVIVETQNHNLQLADLSVEEISKLFSVYKLRINMLSKQKNINYISVFKNHGSEAGTSLIHSHSQIMALSQIPTLVKEECNAVKEYKKIHKKCPYCKIINTEVKSKRLIFSTKNVVAFAPFASRFNYEAWIFVKQHKTKIEVLEEEIHDIALALKKILIKLKELDVAYNFFIHYSPEKEDLHFHIEITPRLATWGGFEISTNATINSVLPEDAARFYRT